jgi:phosphoribosylformylglycinamidine synthase
MVGKLPDPAKAPRSAFPEEGLAVVLAGAFRPSLAGSELEKLRGSLSDSLPAIDLAEQARTLAAVREAARSGLVRAAHDVAEGGLAVALAEMALPGGIGVDADIRGVETRAADEGAFEAAAFGEGPGGVILACAPSDLEALSAICGEIPFERIGATGGSRVKVAGATASLSLQVEEAAKAYEEAVPSSFE